MRRFSRREFEERVERARALMTDAGIDALLVTSEANFRYLTGFVSQTWVSPTRPRYFVLPRVGEPVAIVPTCHLLCMHETSWISDIRTWQAPRPADDGISLLVEAVKAIEGQFARVGAELGPETRLGMPVGDFLRVQELLEPTKIVDGQGILRAIRMVKSPAEVDRIRHIAEIVSDAFEAMPNAIAVGEIEREVCRKLQADIIRRGAEKIPYLVAASGPGGYESSIMDPSDRVLRRGDLLFIDTGSTFDGYFCDYDRHFAFDEPIDEAKRAHDLVYRATDAGIAGVRPGCRARDVWRAMAEVLASAGTPGSIVGRMGHGLGLALTEPPSIHPADETELAPGMVLTIEPSVLYRLPDAPPNAGPKLMLHEENVVITDDGCQLLSRRASPDIPVIV